MFQRWRGRESAQSNERTGQGERVSDGFAHVFYLGFQPFLSSDLILFLISFKIIAEHCISVRLSKKDFGTLVEK